WVPVRLLVGGVNGITNSVYLAFGIVLIHNKPSSRRREEVIDPSAVERPFSATGRTRCPSLDVVAVIKRGREGAALHECEDRLQPVGRLKPARTRYGAAGGLSRIPRTTAAARAGAPAASPSAMAPTVAPPTPTASPRPRRAL